MDKALDAYEHGVACDETVHSKEARMCLLNVCCSQPNHANQEDNCIQWLRAALNHRDCEIGSADGVMCTRMCLESCKARGNYQVGWSFCQQLASLHDIVITELIQPYMQVFNESSELNDSVSMECSDSLVC